MFIIDISFIMNGKLFMLKIWVKIRNVFILCFLLMCEILGYIILEKLEGDCDIIRMVNLCLWVYSLYVFLGDLFVELYLGIWKLFDFLKKKFNLEENV